MSQVNLVLRCLFPAIDDRSFLLAKKSRAAKGYSAGPEDVIGQTMPRRYLLPNPAIFIFNFFQHSEHSVELILHCLQLTSL